MPPGAPEQRPTILTMDPVGSSSEAPQSWETIKGQGDRQRMAGKCSNSKHFSLQSTLLVSP